MELKSHIENTLPSCTVIIPEPTIRLDSAKASLTIKHINEKLRNMNINMLRNDNITANHISKKGLHLNAKGTGRLGLNIITCIRYQYLGFYPEIIWPHKAGCRNSNDNIAIPLEKTKGLNDSDNIHSHLLNIQNPISFPMHVILSHNTYLTDLTCYEINKSPLCQKKKRASSLNPSEYNSYTSRRILR